MERFLRFTLFFLFFMIRHVAPYGCCRVKQHEMSYAGSLKEADNIDSNMTRISFSGGYDFRKRQYGRDVYMEKMSTSEITHYQVYQFFQKNEQYVVMDGSCSRMDFPEPKRCLDADASLIGSDNLVGGSIIVDSWRKTITKEPPFRDMYQTTTREKCIPILKSVIIMNPKRRGMLNTTHYSQSDGNYVNFTEGIKEQDRWFKLPECCHNNTIEFTDDAFESHPELQLFEEIFL